MTMELLLLLAACDPCSIRDASAVSEVEEVLVLDGEEDSPAVEVISWAHEWEALLERYDLEEPEVDFSTRQVVAVRLYKPKCTDPDRVTGFYEREAGLLVVVNVASQAWLARCDDNYHFVEYWETPKAPVERCDCERCGQDTGG